MCGAWHATTQGRSSLKSSAILARPSPQYSPNHPPSLPTPSTHPTHRQTPWAHLAAAPPRHEAQLGDGAGKLRATPCFPSQSTPPIHLIHSPPHLYPHQVGNKVVLVPYRRQYVATYHEWMQSPFLQAMTASEPLSLEEEYAMQASWHNDEKSKHHVCGWVDGRKSDCCSLLPLFICLSYPSMYVSRVYLHRPGQEPPPLPILLLLLHLSSCGHGRGRQPLPQRPRRRQVGWNE